MGSISQFTTQAFLGPVGKEKLIERTVMDKLKVKFKLKMPYQNISGNESLREVLCSIEQTLDGFGQLDEQKEVNGANNSQKFTTIGIKINSSVVLC